ncbi:transposase [Oleiagrimonas soli]|uniref:Transposase n=1 Tax=Oleiagrimonas soli TaxID=1543381 RepID=A0A099CY09_9GAMM|nr:transposase [Oleiagrimonas soli]MBB6184234.1 transposase [Oleiagrimonas soli]
MSGKRYTEEFKIAAVKQVTERGHRVAEVAARLGITTHSLYAWIRRYGETNGAVHGSSEQAAELRRVKAELRRVTGERDILKKAAASHRDFLRTYFAKQSG